MVETTLRYIAGSKKYETKVEDIMEDRHSIHKLEECLSNLKKAQRKIVVLEKLIDIKKCN